MKLYHYIMASYDKKNWERISPNMELDSRWMLGDPNSLFSQENQYPYWKYIRQEGRIRTVMHVRNDTYWQIKNGHHCPTCRQFVFGSP